MLQKNMFRSLMLFCALGFVLLFQHSFVFALSAPEDVRVLEASDRSLHVDWSDVVDAAGYYIYYGTQPGNDAGYEVEGVDLIEESEYILSNLQANTTYYIAISAADESIVESELSDEFSYSTLISGSDSVATSLRVEEVSEIDETSIEIIFSKNLNATPNAVREFILEEKESGEEILISLSEIDQENPTRLIALLESELKENTEYELTVLDIQDEDGGSISLGIDAFTTFLTQSFQDDEIDLSSAEPEQTETISQEMNEEILNEEILNEEKDDTEEILQENPETNEQQESNENTQDQIASGNNAGENISLETTAYNAAQDVEKLPQAGPEHWILAFLAFLLAGGIFYKNRK